VPPLDDVDALADDESVDLVADAGASEQPPRAEAIIGDDDRRPVKSIRSVPFRCIGQLLAWERRDRSGRGIPGTAFFIGRRTLLTAGHCLPNWSTRAEVYPGCEGDRSTAPFGRYDVTDRRFFPGRLDLAAIRIADPVPAGRFGDAFGFLRCMVVTAAQVHGRVAAVSGYPQNPPNSAEDCGPEWVRPDQVQATQYRSASAIGAHGDRLYYLADTCAGQSGSPVMMRSDQPGAMRTVVVGIHIQGGNAAKGNVAVRFTPTVGEFARSALAEFEGTAA